MKKHTSILVIAFTSLLAVSCQTTPSEPVSASSPQQALAPLPAWTKSKKVTSSRSVQIKIQSKLIENTFEPGSSGIPAKPYQKRLSEKELQVYLRSLSQKKGTDIMTSPSIVSLPGQTAQIQIGRKFVYPSLEKPDSLEKEFTGVTQYFRAQPSQNGAIKIDSVTEVKEFVKFQKRTDGKEQPIFNTRRVIESFTLPRGESIVLGGLVTEETQQVEDKTPLLGDIPAVGRLFRSKATVTLKKDLLVLISATQIDPTGRAIR
ncbi:hypothetical protein N9821_00560 [Akkermansiaceae bacterium]|nr:hypothetical protein [Akkermansiaceae bacterium]MDB4570566.1 hypothetical protein [Akkermansiaceae bacterium]